MTRCTILILLSFVIYANCHSQTYCTPTFDSRFGLGIDFIDNFSFYTLKNLYSGQSSSGYTLYPESKFTTTINIGESYPITVSKDVTSGGSNWWVAWIDYNNDGKFSSKELILVDTSYSYSAYAMAKIPYDTSFVGKRRLRILHANGAAFPCGTYQDGECEDYTITIAKNAPHKKVYGMPVQPYFNGLAFDTFKLNTLEHFHSHYDSTSYIDYSDSAFTTTLSAGSTYDIDIADSIFAGILGGFAVWIDINNDTVFSPSELLYIDSNYDYSTTGKIKIPLSVVDTGYHTVRVRSYWGTLDNTTSPYGLCWGGSTQDFSVRINTITGISKQFADNESFIVYPNPVKDNLYLNNKNHDRRLIQITNTMGQEMYSGYSVNELTSVNVYKFPPGVYFLSILSDNNLLTNYKIIKY